MDVRLPDGTIIQNVPDGTTRAQIAEKLRANGIQIPDEWLSEPSQITAPEGTKLGRQHDSVGRQIGLYGRAATRGIAGIAELGAEPLRYITDRAYEFGTGRKSSSVPLSILVDRGANAIGLPEPQTPTERKVSKAVEIGTGTMGFAGGAKAFGAALTGASKTVAERLAADPLMQVVTGAGAGYAGQQAKEADASPLGQALSAFGGGLIAAGGLGLARGGAEAARSMIPTVRDTTAQRIDVRINMALERSGIDPKSIDPAMRKFLHEQAAAALKTGGDLNDDAIARLADYRRLGLEPTRSRLTLDPYDVTVERNAEKFAAAAGVRDAKLPQIAQENNRRLLNAVEGFGPIGDTYNAGSAAKAPIVAFDARLKAAEDAAYTNARNMAGGDIPLVRGKVMQAIDAQLDREMKGPFVPDEIRSILNRLKRDPNAPFTVATIDNLKTIIADAQKTTGSGNVKRALSIIRDQLDSAPIEPMKRAFGADQAVTRAIAQTMQQADDAAPAIKKALDEARALAFKRRTWQESSPVIKDVIEGIEPEHFIKKHLLSSVRGFDELSKAAPIINSDPAARNAVRGAVVHYLKGAAIGKGNTTDTANFSGRQWLSALSNIGDKRLGLFFDGSEVETLKAIGRTGSIETFQPRGSAVNNSNTAAGVAQLLQGLSRFVRPVANKVPLGFEIVSAPLDATTMSVMQRQALNIPRGLLMPMPQGPTSPVDPLLSPMLATTGGLLAQ